VAGTGGKNPRLYSYFLPLKYNTTEIFSIFGNIFLFCFYYVQVKTKFGGCLFPPVVLTTVVTVCTNNKTIDTVKAVDI
jgi:hypothetical protein